ncbi:MAG: hypothetical protein NTX45_22620 [Proteobacteria bacterium]|nr:hypothetical protein [Pseudomonadota bacterium]
MNRQLFRIKIRWLWWVVATATILLTLGIWLTFNGMTEEYASFSRPDGHYRVVVLRKKMFMAMPGQASDAPGIVQLYNQNGVMLHEVSIDMVQMVDHVDWEEKKLSIKLVADWELPD